MILTNETFRVKECFQNISKIKPTLLKASVAFGFISFKFHAVNLVNAG